MSNAELHIDIAKKEDIDEFVIPSWMQSYTRSLPAKWLRADSRYGVGRSVYWVGQRGKIEKILATPTSRVLLATVTLDDEVHKAGWACEDRTKRILHYVYVREGFRMQGVANKLAGWINEGNEVVRLSHLPPPWYSRGDSGLWKPNVVIDLVSEV